MNKKRLAILGSTGSIGRQTLDVAREYPELFSVELLVARSSVELLAAQALEFRPRRVVIACEELSGSLRAALTGTGIEVLCGEKAIADAVDDSAIDTVVTAMVGYSGLEPTIRAIKAGKDIALANKETLVVAGELITGLLKESTSKVYPVDSEHGAFFQCLMGERDCDVAKLYLTASGGPFRNTPVEQLEHVTVDDALRHPKWNMGAKITIDSATMMNKGFEMIEARWLFGVMPDKIEIVVHPQSIIHSMVEFVDGSVKAQLGLPDMRLPIRFALGLPQGRLATHNHHMSLSDFAQLTFEKPDFNKFPLLKTAYQAAGQGGNAPCVMNAANEIAVAAFLNREIGFNDIYRTVDMTLNKVDFVARPTYDDLVATNQCARLTAQKIIKQQSHN